MTDHARHKEPRLSSVVRRPTLVGLGRLELPTSRLSSARSNQLSYKPGTRGRTTDIKRQMKSSVVRRPTSVVRLRRKRNEDGGVPPNGSLIKDP